MDLNGVVTGGQGGTKGLICGHDMVDCSTDLHIMHEIFLQPRNTLLLRSGSLVPFRDPYCTFCRDGLVVRVEVPSSIE